MSLEIDSPRADTRAAEYSSTQINYEDPPAEALDEISSLNDRALFLQAFERSRPYGSILGWRSSARAMLVASRLALHLGAEFRGNYLAASAFRRDPTDPWCALYRGYLIFRERGALAFWLWSRENVLGADAPADLRAEMLCLRGTAAADLRDFERASLLLDEARTIGPRVAECANLRAHLLEREDRYAEAVEVAIEAVTTFPDDRGVYQQCAHLLMIEGRRDEAIDVLQRADRRFESAVVARQLAGLLLGAQRYADAARCMDRFEALSPLLEPRQLESLRIARADCAFRAGNIDRAKSLLDGVDEPWWRAFRTRLDQPELRRRVCLDVPFVRQRDRTCAPATLAALSRFWGRTVDQDVIANAICYDGTPDHRERAWAEENGWFVREATITWDIAVALIDRGVPFSLSTFGTTSGHAQAVIGYDVMQGALIIRDPFIYGDLEVRADALFASQASSGPRGLVLVPIDQEAKLEGVDLGDDALYDLLHKLQRHLVGHDRVAAQRELESLQILAPDHRLVHAARRAVAVYDEDTTALLACAEDRLRSFPTSDSAAFEAIVLMRSTATRAERIARLDERIKVSRDPIFLELLADELAADDRERERARRLAQLAVRRSGLRAEPVGLLGSIYWGRQSFDEALDLFRFAACLHDRNEQRAARYALSARVVGRAEEALRFLRDRVSRLGASSAAPIYTVARVLDALGRTAEAVRALEDTLDQRPDDAELALLAVAPLASAGRVTRARAALERARGKTPPTAWGRAAATLSGFDLPAEAQLSAWLACLEREPLAVDAHEIVFSLLAVLRGVDEARRHLAEAHARFPHHITLSHLWLSRLDVDDPSAREAALRAHLISEPEDAWAYRELSLVLAITRRFDEAVEACDRARALVENDPRGPLVLGRVLWMRGDLDGARGAFRAAIALEADSPGAIQGLLALGSSREERDAEIISLAQTVKVSSIDGSGINAWYDHAGALADSSTLDSLIDELRNERPDLAAVWSIQARHHLAFERFAEARRVAIEATQRFAMSSLVWTDLAYVEAARADVDAQIAALVRAHEVSPFDVSVARKLAAVYERSGRVEDARSVLERMAAREPGSVSIALALASLERELGRRGAALDRVRSTLVFAPTNHEALDVFESWSAETGEAGAAERFVRERLVANAASPALHLTLGSILVERERFDEAIAEADEALRLSPYASDARDLKAFAYAASGRFDEAKKACSALSPDEAVPPSLLGRAAWIEAVRGDLPAAIQAMRSLLARHPSFVWGWHKLAEWHRRCHDPVAQVECCRELVKLSPAEGAPHAALGFARMAAGDRDGARRSFERALTLDADDAPTAKELFDLQIEDRDLDGAERSLRSVRKRFVSNATLMEVELAIHRGDEDRAFAAFRRLAVMSSDAVGLALGARRRLVWAGYADRVQDEIEGMLDDDALLPAFAANWARASLRRGDVDVDSLLDRFAPTSTSARAAALVYLSQMTEEHRWWDLVRWIFRRRRWLLGHPALWSGVTQALLDIKSRSIALVWLARCPVSSTHSPTFLLPVVRALLSVGKIGRALLVAHHGRLDDSPASSHLAAWLALESATDGAVARANDWIAIAQRHSLAMPERDLAHLAKIIVYLRGAAVGERDEAFRDGGDDLNRTLQSAHAALGFHGRRRLVRARFAIARDVRSFEAWRWAIRGWLVNGGLVLLLVLALFVYSPYVGSGGVAVEIALVIWTLLWENSGPPSIVAPSEIARLASAPSSTEAP